MQVLHVLDDAIAQDRVTFSRSHDEVFAMLASFFRRETGVPRLARAAGDAQEFTQWFLGNDDVDEVLDAIELICRIIDHMIARSSYEVRKTVLRTYVPEINARLLEASIGYQFESNQIIEADSKYLHAEVVVPALHLLSDPKYAAADKEFLAAHDAFREQDYEQCLVECCKAFESVIKVIGAERSWGLSPNASAATLVKAVFDKKLIPDFLENEFTGIRTVLESGVNTVRNKSGGHGAGTEVRVVPRHLAAFQLHQTAAAITLLAESHAAS